MCQIRPVSEQLARVGARLRTATGRAASISATNAVVAGLAIIYPDPVVLTSDRDDLNVLVAGHDHHLSVARVWPRRAISPLTDQLTSAQTGDLDA